MPDKRTMRHHIAKIFGCIYCFRQVRRPAAIAIYTCIRGDFRTINPQVNNKNRTQRSSTYRVGRYDCCCRHHGGVRLIYYGMIYRHKEKSVGWCCCRAQQPSLINAIMNGIINCWIIPGKLWWYTY